MATARDPAGLRDQRRGESADPGLLHARQSGGSGANAARGTAGDGGRADCTVTRPCPSLIAVSASRAERGEWRWRPGYAVAAPPAAKPTPALTRPCASGCSPTWREDQASHAPGAACRCTRARPSTSTTPTTALATSDSPTAPATAARAAQDHRHPERQRMDAIAAAMVSAHSDGARDGDRRSSRTVTTLSGADHPRHPAADMALRPLTGL